MAWDVAKTKSSVSCDMTAMDLVHADDAGGFDTLTRLCSRMLNVPISMVSIVDEDQDQQCFTSAIGLPEPWNTERKTPLSYSFCQHVKRRNAPLIVGDARQTPLVADNRAVSEVGIIAYLGMPIHLPDGTPIGAICAIDTKPRNWTARDIEMLKDVSASVDSEILLRSTVIQNRQSLAKNLRYNAMRESIARAFMLPDLTIDARFQEMLRASCQALGMQVGQITKIEAGTYKSLFNYCTSPQITERACARRLNTLAKLVTRECRHIRFSDLSMPAVRQTTGISREAVGSYIGTPLILNGVLYGAVEFYRETPRPDGWTEEELTILSMVSMFSTAHLGLFGQITVLRNSERALLNYISHCKSPAQPMDSRFSA